MRRCCTRATLCWLARRSSLPYHSVLYRSVLVARIIYWVSALHRLSVRQDEVETSIDDDDVFTASTKLAVRIHFADGTLRAAKVAQICMARL